MIDVKMNPGFPMRDLELRRCIEGVLCPHAPLRGFSKRKRSRNEKTTASSSIHKAHTYNTISLAISTVRRYGDG